MDPEWNKLLSSGDYVGFLSGDLKYMLTMLGHAGASSVYPCMCCARSRKLLAWRSWIPEELEHIKQQQPKTFAHSNDQMRAYPDNPDCPHDVKGETCLCISQGAKFVRDEIKTKFPVESQQFPVHAQEPCPFHKEQVKLSKQHAYSIVTDPLLPLIPLLLRLAGIWHCTHNVRVMLWLMLKDIATQCGVIPALQQSMDEIDLGHVRVTADKKKRREANIEEQIRLENVASAEAISKEEEKNSRNTKSSMNGKELVIVFDAFDRILANMNSTASDECERLKLQRWGEPVRRALTAFNEGCRTALADIWTTNRSDELSKFRTFVDEMMTIPASAGLPYVVREYLAILPIHYLSEPTHLQGMSSSIWEQYGVAPGSMTDATTEMVRTFSCSF